MNFLRSCTFSSKTINPYRILLKYTACGVEAVLKIIQNNPFISSKYSEPLKQLWNSRWFLDNNVKNWCTADQVTARIPCIMACIKAVIVWIIPSLDLSSLLLAFFLSENYIQGTVDPPFRLQTTYGCTSKEDV